MNKRICLALVTWIVCTVAPSVALARYCIPEPIQTRIERAPIIFKGRLIKIDVSKEKLGTRITSSFQVESVYKGSPGPVVDILYSSDFPEVPIWLKQEHEYYVIAEMYRKNGPLSFGNCGHPIAEEELGTFGERDSAAQLVAELEIHNAKLDAVDRMIDKYPDKDWLYVRKAEILDEVKESEKASIAYEKALELARKRVPGWMSPDKLSAEERIITELVRTLYGGGRYKEIIEPSRLALTQQDPRISDAGKAIVRKYLAAAYIRQGDNEGLKKLAPVNVSGLNFDYVDFSGLSLDHSNFANASLQEAKFGNASLREADFRGANLLGVSYKESDLTGAQYDCTTRLNLVNNPSNQKQMVGPPVCR